MKLSKKGVSMSKREARLFSLLTALLLSLLCAIPVHSGGEAPKPALFGSEDKGYPFWCYAGKTGIGTSYEQYFDTTYDDRGPTGTISKVRVSKKAQNQSNSLPGFWPPENWPKRGCGGHSAETAEPKNRGTLQGYFGRPILKSGLLLPRALSLKLHLGLSMRLN